MALTKAIHKARYYSKLYAENNFSNCTINLINKEARSNWKSLFSHINSSLFELPSELSSSAELNT